MVNISNGECVLSVLSKVDYDNSLDLVARGMNEHAVRDLTIACAVILGEGFDHSDPDSWGTHNPLHGLIVREVFVMARVLSASKVQSRELEEAILGVSQAKEVLRESIIFMDDTRNARPFSRDNLLDSRLKVARARINLRGSESKLLGLGE